MEFRYNINEQEDHETLDSSFCIQRSPARSEVVKIERNANGGTEIKASKDGWVYLAKVCLEMAYLAEKDPLFHSHRTSSFEISKKQSEDAVALFQVVDKG